MGVNLKSREKSGHAIFFNQNAESYEATYKKKVFLSFFGEDTLKTNLLLDLKKSIKGLKLLRLYCNETILYVNTMFSILFKIFISGVLGPFSQLVDWKLAQILYNFVGMS